MDKKIIKKAICVAGAVLITSNCIAPAAEASTLGDTLKKIFSPAGNRGTSTKKSTQPRQDTAMVSRSEMPLDGTYISVVTPGQVKYSIDVAEHYFTLEKPAVLNVHVISHNSQMVYNHIVDADGNKLIGVHAHGDDVNNEQFVLSPGRYTIRSKRNEFIDSHPRVDFEMKVNKEDLQVNVPNMAFRRGDAPVMQANVAAYDYIPQIGYDMKNTNKYRYYAFDVFYPCEVKVAMERLTDKLNLHFALVDADENVINSWDGIGSSDVHIEKSFTLQPGRYYLRLNRNHYSGGAYMLMIK